VVAGAAGALGRELARRFLAARDNIGRALFVSRDESDGVNATLIIR